MTMIALVFGGCAEAAGLRVLKTAGGRVGVWYPTATPATPGRLGPFDVEYAFNAAPTAGRWEPVLLSHGNSGRFRNHHLTAGALADAGFVVISPQHSADHYIGGNATAGAMSLRIGELRRALEAVAADPVLGPTVDRTRVHAVGYSLGGATVMAAAGAEIDLKAAEAHCEIHGDEDAAFCDPPPLHWRLWQKLRNRVSFKEMPDRFFIQPFVNGSVAVVAPIGQGLKFPPKRFAAAQALVIAIEGDEIAQPRFHAAAIASALPPGRLAALHTVPGHHYAFIAPFAERVTSKEHIPVAIDPEGFDRTTFIDRVNGLLARFFRPAN